MLRASGPGETAKRDLPFDDLPSVTLIQGDASLRLQKAAYRVEGPSAWRAMVPGQNAGGADIFSGPRAAVRLATAVPIFEVRSPANAQFAASISLFRLNTDSGARRLERDIGRQDDSLWSGAGKGRHRADVIRLSIELLPAEQAANHAMVAYSVRSQSPLPPGEYLLAIGLGPDYYDFGLDR
jgi:hypothetical protein